jgi:hypothetical protein
MAKPIRRELLTDLLLERLRAVLETGGPDEVLVGDHEAPSGGGWPDEEGEGTFANYCVLTPLPTGQPMGSIAHPEEMLLFPYALTSIAVSRRGAENASDRARAALTGLIRQNTADDLRVQQGQTQGYGGTERIDVVDPPFFAVTDTVNVFVSQS